MLVFEGWNILFPNNYNDITWGTEEAASISAESKLRIF